MPRTDYQMRDISSVGTIDMNRSYAICSLPDIRAYWLSDYRAVNVFIKHRYAVIDGKVHCELRLTPFPGMAAAGLVQSRLRIDSDRTIVPRRCPPLKWFLKQSE
jgi:hypothetical protein